MFHPVEIFTVEILDNLISKTKLLLISLVEEKLPPSERPRESLHITEFSVKHRLVGHLLIFLMRFCFLFR